MSQSAFHVAIVMDGNGRWATRRGRPRVTGHQAGAETVRRIVETAPTLGIDLLTLYAFSGDNWRRPRPEVDALLTLFSRYLRGETATFVATGIRLSIIGRRDRVTGDLRRAIAVAEAATAGGTALHLRIAIDYSARDAIASAAGRAGVLGVLDRERFARLLGEAMHAFEPSRDVDLLIRTGGEQRLSDFLLWECAYAELLFSAKLWPDWTPEDLRTAVRDFRGRERRFGGLPAAG